MKHPFSFLFESTAYPHARTLRTSLWQKVLDSFRVAHGDSSPEKGTTLGLFDLVTLGIPAGLNWLTQILSQRYEELLVDDELHPVSIWETLLFEVIDMLNITFNEVPRFLFSAFIALIAFIPITLPVHLIAKTIDYFMKDNLDAALTLEDQYGNTLQRALDEDDDIEEIQANIVEETINFYVIHKTGKNERLHELNRFQYDKNSYAIKAMFSHNIGKIASSFPYEAERIADQNDYLVEVVNLNINWTGR